MKNPLDRLLVVACLGLGSISMPAHASTYTFNQSGFVDGGVVSGYFVGSDLNADGFITMLSLQQEITDFSLRYTGGSRMPDVTMDFDDLLRSLTYGMGLQYTVGSSTIGAGPGMGNGYLYVFDIGTSPLPLAGVFVLPESLIGVAGAVFSITDKYSSITLDFMNVSQAPAPGKVPQAAIPEPTGLGLFGVGAALLAARRRRPR